MGTTHRIFSLAFAVSSTAKIHQLRREGQATQEWAEMLIALSSEQGFEYWVAFGTFLQGWVLAE